MKILKIVLFIILVSELSATIINIPTNQPTIQEGINYANVGDTILVQPGIYDENIIIEKEIVLISTQGAETTIIEGNSGWCVVEFNFWSLNQTSPIFEGFTVRNGGGIGIINDSTPFISNVIIKNNNRIGRGGGIYCSGNVFPTLRNVLIINNSAQLDPNSGYHSWGGGIFCQNDSGITLINCTISNNSSEFHGAIYGHNNVYLTNCIIWNNFPNNMSDEIIATYIDFEGGWSGIGNIDINPLFFNSDVNNYHLSAYSPCIDVGDPSFPLDPDGTPSDMGTYYFHQTLNFSANNRFGNSVISTNFEDLSVGNISGWYWDFENDGVYDSTDQNPTHIYNSPGLYDVKLKIIRNTTSDSLIKHNFIIVQDSQLLPPQNPLITISGSDVILNWDTVTNANHYLIYSSDNPQGEFVFLDYTTNTTYVNSGIISEKDNFFYCIIGFDGMIEDLTRFINNNRSFKAETK